MKKITDELLMDNLIKYMRVTKNEFCNCLVADLESNYKEYGFIHAMVFLHQQNAEDFKNAFAGTYFYSLLISMFDELESDKEFICYRGDTYPAIKGNIFIDTALDTNVFKSFTTDYDVAKRFALAKAKDNGETGVIFTCIPRLYLDCKPYGVVDDEAEIFIFSPRKMISIECVYEGDE